MKSLRGTLGWGLSLVLMAAASVLLAAVGPAHSIGATETAAASQTSGRVVLYTGIGPQLTQYDLDVNAATLTKRESVVLPGSVTEVAFHPSKKYLYAVWGNVKVTPRTHGLSAFRIDGASGALTPHGPTMALKPGPGYVSYVTTDIPGKNVMAALTDPADLTVYRIASDGTIGAEAKPKAPLDFANHPHQVRVDPSNKTVILITRGDAPRGNQKENPGALKLFSYKNGILANTETIAPNGGFGYQARHLDFHPSGKWDYLTLEAQQKLLVYKRKSDGTLDPTPLFTKETLEEPGNVRQGQILGTVRVDRAGKFLYAANRASGATVVDGKRVSVGGENSIAVYAINQATGEPTKIQSIDSHGFHPRTIAFDPSGKLLVAYNIHELNVRDGQGMHLVPANLAIFRVHDDGTLEFVRTYDVALGDSQDWMGIMALP